jgi:hypothetical protein
MPWTLIVPTGSVETTRESIDAWFKAGVACVGVGSNLLSKELIAAGNFAAITQKTASVLTVRDPEGAPGLRAGAGAAVPISRCVTVSEEGMRNSHGKKFPCRQTE